MKKQSKVLLAMLCAVLLVVSAVCGTLAYLTDKDSAVNTFTVGKVDIELDEADVKEDGTYETDHENRVKENKYHLLPGHTYIKDPTVTVKAGSEEVYVRMLVTVEDLEDLKAALPSYVDANDVFLLEKLVTGWDRSNWEINNVNDNVYEFRYVGADHQGTKPGTVQKTDEDIKLDDLFEEIKMPGEIDNADLAKLEDLKITVVAQAIQADGFANADAAWAQWKN